MTYSIPFTSCPVEHHKGEMWEKLQGLDLKKPVIIKDIIYLWSNDLPIEKMRKDTFSDFTRQDWMELMFSFYKLYNVYGMLIIMEHPDVGRITTFRAYKPETVRYYIERKDEGTKIYLKVRS